MKISPQESADLIESLREKLKGLEESPLIGVGDFYQFNDFIKQEIIRYNDIQEMPKLSVGEHIYLDLLRDLNIELSGTLRDVSEAIRKNIQEASFSADWHKSLIEGK
ncbi:hypothetical protein [Lelliottia wanjuensis]|uniref:hypothetical protein n=1 Tax=Lelliottia wanjuensis TaxID=3050585 RepID=UPI00254DB8ED|nr:hypothetical protein [Lelliottia sp. V106_16]MDK9356718.1 hypothetical protein [Lelliottia sp. V106_16]